MSFPVNGFQRASSVYGGGDLGPAGNSVQLMFAALQLSQSRLCKDEATKRMKELQGVQSLQKEFAAKIAEARRLQEMAKEKGTAEASQAFVDFCKANGIELPRDGKPVTSFKLNAEGLRYLERFGDSEEVRAFLKGKDINNLSESELEGLAEALSQASAREGYREYVDPRQIGVKESKIIFTDKEWDSILKNLTGRQELLGGNTQTVMVYLQDFIGQYNSFLQGANSAIATANQVLTGIAKGQ